jgi:hypothetical protein
LVRFCFWSLLSSPLLLLLLLLLLLTMILLSVFRVVYRLLILPHRIHYGKAAVESNKTADAPL